MLVALVALSLITGSANAATKKPSPTPTTTKKATVKPTVKPTVKATPKTTTKASAKPTAKTTSPAKKKVVYKQKPRKKVKLSPSPKPVWPPKGYVKSDDIYAKLPTSKELIGLSSANPKLAKELLACESLTCGAIMATSIAGCNWWEFTADVTGPTSETDKTIIKYGTLKSLFSSSKPKEIRTFIMVSEEPIKTGLLVSNIAISCHRDPQPTDITFPTHSYIKSNTEG